MQLSSPKDTSIYILQSCGPVYSAECKDEERRKFVLTHGQAREQGWSDIFTGLNFKPALPTLISGLVFSYTTILKLL